jgi:hypothetical protein
LQCASRRRAASRERLDGGVVMGDIFNAFAFFSLKGSLDCSYCLLGPAAGQALIACHCTQSLSPAKDGITRW